MKLAYVYILTNNQNKVLYTGVTSNLIRRIAEHKEGLVKGFTRKYNAKKLVYFEVLEDIRKAIIREKQIKAGRRAKKLEMIESVNPNWDDLYETLS